MLKCISQQILIQIAGKYGWILINFEQITISFDKFQQVLFELFSSHFVLNLNSLNFGKSQ